MARISKSVYINKLDDIVDKYNNPSHRSIKVKPDTSKTYIGFGIENNDKDPKF